MKPRKMMAMEHEQADMWHLSGDRRSVRMELPALQVDGLPTPLKVKMYFSAGVVDQMIDRLIVLRARMLPAPPAPAKRH